MKIASICFFLFLIFFIPQILNAQNIIGKVKDVNDAFIENASISFWNSENKETLYGYAYSNQKGDFSFNLKPEHKAVFIEVSALDYASTSKSIALNTVNEFPLKLNFILETKEIILEEVIVKKENIAVKVKNDTVFYDPKKFLNGTERKIEDLIKKLPGMTVNEATGEIKYKGKSVAAVKLEDDDLFGGNYAVGTKNISVDMVEQVQAIENYSANPLLKGIENSDKVAINLKLKKSITDFSGSANLSNGYSDKLLFNDDATLLGISTKIKSFGVIAYNNFGQDADNLTSSSEDYNPDQITKEEFYTKKNIYESSGNSLLPNKRTKFNNTFFTNHNIIYKIAPKISVKSNLFYYNDKTEAFESYKNIYFLNNGETIENNQENIYFRKPNFYRADLKLTYNINKTSLLNTDINIKNNIVNSEIATFQNNSDPYDSKLKTDDFFLKAKLDCTLKIAEKKALQFYSIFSKNDIPQEFQSSPNNSFITGINANSSLQYSKFNNQIFFNKLVYLISRKKIKQTFSLGYLATNQIFKSSLTEDGNVVNDFKNDFVYKKSNLFGEYSSTFNIKKIKFQPAFSLKIYKQNLVDKIVSTNLKHNEIIFNSNVLISYILNNLSSFYINGDLENKTPSEEYLFSNKVLLNNTSMKNNLVSLEFIKSESISLGYKYYDLFTQFTFNISAQYSNTHNAFLSNASINPNFSTFTYFQSPANIEAQTYIFGVEKQIKDLKITIKHTSTFSINNYKNAIENFELRNNNSFSYTGNLFMASFFNFPINFENNYSYSIFSFENDSPFKSERTSIINSLKLIGKPYKNLIVCMSSDYYITDVHTNDDFSFVDFDVKYQSSKLKWLSFNLTGKNLLNIKTFSQINNSDYTYSTYQSNLLPRYFLLSMNMNF